MQKLLLNKSKIIKKIIIGVIVIALLSFLIPKIVTATGEKNNVLLKPIQYLILSIADTFLGLIQGIFIGIGSAVAPYQQVTLLGWLIFAVGVAATVLLTIATAGLFTILLVAVATIYLGVSFGVENFDLPIIFYTPEEIFAGQIPGLDVNFINPNDDFKMNILGNEYEVPRESTAFTIQNLIATWYVAIRNLAIVGLLSVLVYIGIRIILSSTGKDKAKYKAMFTDWVISLCLLVSLQYIMSFTLYLTESLTKILSSNSGGNLISVEIPNEYKYKVDIGSGEEEIKVGGTAGDSINPLMVNLMGYARLQAQQDSTGTSLAYTVIYCVLVIFTFTFTMYYIKRLIKLAFLTLIAPLIALTYPIDKVKDGQAQAFQYWLKEYMFNLLIQPFHLLLYTVLVSSSFTLAASNPIYALVAIGFILPAEKMLKSMFGFDKSSTMGGMKGFAAGAVAANLLNKVPSVNKKNGSGGGGKVRTSSPPRIGGSSSSSSSSSTSRGLRITRGGTGTRSGAGARTSMPTSSGGALPGGRGRGRTSPSTGRVSSGGATRRMSAGGRTTRSAGVRGAAGAKPKIKNSPSKNSKFNTLLRGAKGAARVLAPVGRFAGRTAVKAATAGLLGTAGLIGALASDDLDNIGKYTMAGLAGGWAAGGKLANTIPNAVSNLEDGIKGIPDRFREGSMGLTREEANYVEANKNEYLDSNGRIRYDDLQETMDFRADLSEDDKVFFDTHKDQFKSDIDGNINQQELRDALELRHQGFTKMDDLKGAVKYKKLGRTTGQIKALQGLEKEMGISRDQMIAKSKIAEKKSDSELRADFKKAGLKDEHINKEIHDYQKIRAAGGFKNPKGPTPKPTAPPVKTPKPGSPTGKPKPGAPKGGYKKHKGKNKK